MRWIRIPDVTKWLESHPRIVLGGILLLGLILRLICIQTRGIWYDDAFSIFLARQTLPAITTGTAADTMPPLSYILLHYWMELGKAIWFIRLFNVLLGLVVSWLAFLFGKELADQKTGWLFAFLVTISPFQIFHAQEVRMYILLELGLIGSSLMIYKIWKKPKATSLYWLGYVFFGLIALYSHNLAIFTLFFVDFFFLLKRKFALLSRIILAQIVMMIGFLPWLIMVPGQIQKIQTAFWTPRPGLVEVVQAMDTLLGFLPQPTWLIAVLTILGLQAVLMVFWLGWKHRYEDQVQFLVTLVIIPSVLLFMASYLIRPVYVPRALIASGIGFYGLVAYFLGQVEGEKVNGKTKTDPAPWIIMGILMILSIFSLPNQYLYDEFPRSRFDTLSKTLAKACPEQSCLVLHDNKLSFFPTMVYQFTNNQKYLAEPPNTFNDTLAIQSQKAMNQLAQPDVATAVAGSNQVYFVTFQKAEEEYSAMGDVTHPVIKRLTELGYKQKQKEIIGDLYLYEFIYE
jgi:mannosyltransferase